MFSRISELLRPLTIQRNAEGTKKDSGREKRKRPDIQEEASAEDVTLISTGAIRLMLQEISGKKGLDEMFSVLERLEQHGIKSIPVREGQSVWSALDDAARFL